jgi:tetratricopeptide (TPR) repeat protein
MTARDIKLAQAASMMELGDEWMGRPAHPSPLVKYNAASRLFEQAADTFRTYGRWRLAGEAYARAGDAEKKLGELLVAGTYYIDSAECYERVDMTEAVKLCQKAIGLYSTMGRFVSAAAVQSRVAQLFEADGAYASAAEGFQYASDYFLGDDLYSQAVLSLYRAGTCLVEEGSSYAEAHEKFDRGARYAADDNLVKFKVPELMFDAALCLLADGDLPKAEDYVVECSRRDASFAVGRERRFLFDIIDCARASAIDDFIDHAWNFDYVDELDPFELKMLDEIREMILAGPPSKEEEEGDESEEEETDDDSDESGDEGDAGGEGEE